MRKLNLLEDEKILKECEENKVREHQNKNNTDKVININIVYALYKHSSTCMIF